MRYNIANIGNEPYIQMPRALMFGEQYRELSANAKIVYCLLRDRLGFAEENGWIDENGDMYVYYGAESLAEKINQTDRNLRRILNELKTYSLIECKKDGRLNKFYVHHPKEIADKNGSKSGQNLHEQRTEMSPIADNSGQNLHELRTNLSKIADKNVQKSGHGCPPIKNNIIRLNNKLNNNNNNSYPTDTRKRAQDDTPYQEIVDTFNAICTNLPQVKSLSDTRKKAIKARFKELDRDTDKIRQLFTKVQESDFLTGRKEGTNWRAGFDWIMKPSNTAKILEGNYDNREHSSSQGDNGREVDIYAQYEEYERNQRMPWE